eukprot:Platyproteum_vivax@DN3336_c0_g2_i1.p1
MRFFLQLFSLLIAAFAEYNDEDVGAPIRPPKNYDIETLPVDMPSSTSVLRLFTILYMVGIVGGIVVVCILLPNFKVARRKKTDGEGTTSIFDSPKTKMLKQEKDSPV